MKKLPKARSANIVVQNLQNKVLIYDLGVGKAYCLNETAKIVYQACEGETSFEDLKAKSDLTDDLIFLALDKLKKENLIDGKHESVFTETSRREAIKRIGLASMAILPVISSLIAPTAANAQSCRQAGQTGSFGSLAVTSQFLCTNPRGYADPACCSGLSGGGTFTPATPGSTTGSCSGIVCSS